MMLPFQWRHQSNDFYSAFDPRSWRWTLLFRSWCISFMRLQLTSAWNFQCHTHFCQTLCRGESEERENFEANNFTRDFFFFIWTLFRWLTTLLEPQGTLTWSVTWRMLADVQLWFVKSSHGNKFSLQHWDTDLWESRKGKKIQGYSLRLCRETDSQVSIHSSRCPVHKVSACL